MSRFQKGEDESPFHALGQAEPFVVRTKVNKQENPTSHTNMHNMLGHCFVKNWGIVDYPMTNGVVNNRLGSSRKVRQKQCIGGVHSVSVMGIRRKGMQ